MTSGEDPGNLMILPPMPRKSIDPNKSLEQIVELNYEASSDELI